MEKYNNNLMQDILQIINNNNYMLKYKVKI